LLPLYDPLTALLGGDALRRRLLEQATLRDGARVLDIGCGTGALTLQIKRARPDTHVAGLDPDPNALARARVKAQRAHLEIDFIEGFASALPYADASFDAVFSALMLHHLSHSGRQAALAEARRVLSPGGTLHILDFGPPRGRLAQSVGGLLHRAEQMTDNVEGRIPQLMHEAGLTDVREAAHRNTAMGSMAYYSARVQGAPAA
jgi:ubiquinone/menaquinone biosynthesis C-methylase UbiE